MKFSELIGKNVINLSDGKNYGKVKVSDLVFEKDSGHIESIILHNYNLTGKKYLIIPWARIKKVGSKSIIVNVNSE